MNTKLKDVNVEYLFKAVLALKTMDVVVVKPYRLWEAHFKMAANRPVPVFPGNPALPVPG